MAKIESGTKRPLLSDFLVSEGLPEWAAKYKGGRISLCGHIDPRQIYEDLRGFAKGKAELAEVLALLFVRDFLSQSLHSYWRPAWELSVFPLLDPGTGACSRLPSQTWLSGIPEATLRTQHARIVLKSTQSFKDFCAQLIRWHGHSQFREFQRNLFWDSSLDLLTLGATEEVARIASDFKELSFCEDCLQMRPILSRESLK